MAAIAEHILANKVPGIDEGMLQAIANFGASDGNWEKPKKTAPAGRQQPSAGVTISNGFASYR